MIKRLLLATICFAGAFLPSSGDEQKKITLNNDDHNTETIKLAYGNIFVSIKNVDENDNVEVSIELENEHESNTLYLFDRAYDEKSLKKLSPSITYDKVFGGTKGKREIDKCPEIKFPTRIQSSERTILFNLSGTDKSPLVCKLPIYIVKNKNRKGSKMLLLEKDVIELEIQIQLKPDENFIRVTEEFASLTSSIDAELFCTNKNHSGESFETLKQKYEDKISNLKKEIKGLIESRGYYPSDKAYKNYMEIYNKLDAISIDSKTVSSCSKDKEIKQPIHRCSNCSLSYEAIYKKLENYYIDIHNGKKTKAQVVGDVESLNKCVNKNTRRTGNSSYKSRITTYYNKIKSFK